MTAHGSHDAHLVTLSIAIAIFGSYTALDLFRRVHGNIGRARNGWLAAAALAMGLSIWSMHFVAMLAFDLGLPVAYDPGRTVLSLLVAVGATGVAFATAARPQPTRPRLLVAGFGMGLGISGMHYLGMAAMRLPADLDYDPLLVALSLLIAVGASTAALVLALRDRTSAWQVAGAVAAGLAISGMHYVGMLAASFVPSPGGSAAWPGIHSPSLAFSVAAATFAILLFALLASNVDRRLARLALDQAEALRHARDELEQRVRERTQDFGQANARLEAEIVERRRAEEAARESAARLREAAESLQLAVEATKLGIWDVNTASGWRHWSPEFKAILGLPPEAIPDLELFTALIHPEDREAVVARYRQAYEAGSSGRYDAEYRIRRADDGAERWVHVTGRIIPNEDGRPTRGIGTLKDVTERRRAHDALRESEERYRTLVETSPDAVFAHQDGCVVFANGRAAKLFGVATSLALIGRPVFDLVEEASLPLARERTAALRVPGAHVGLAELTYRRLDGIPFPVEADAAAVLIGGRLAVQVVFRDIAERRRSEERQALLLGELNHRAKNMLALTQAVARQTAARTATPTAFLAAFQGRLDALAAAHDLLMASGWQGADLRSLLERTLAVHRQGEAGRLEIAAAVDLPLGPAIAQDLSLAVHELATNAVKHGALSVPEGRVRLTAEAASAGGTRELRLVWREEGGPPVARPATGGFGMTLLAQVLAHQHRGHVELDWRPEGLACAMRLPLTTPGRAF